MVGVFSLRGGAAAQYCATSGLAIGLAAVVGCASSPDSGAVNNGLGTLKPEAMAAANGTESMKLPADPSEAELAAMLKNTMRLYEDGLFEDPAAKPKPPLNPDDQADAAEDSTVLAEVIEGGIDESETEVLVDAPPTAGERIRDLSDELERVLRESSDDPYVLSIRLAGLLAGEEAAADRLESLIDRLPEEQRAVARAVADIVSRAGSDPAALTEALVSQADALDEARPIRIRTLAMCSRVEGFGRYTELASTAFVAGSPMRMIIYSEVDHFDRVEMGRTPGNGLSDADREPGFEVRLSQELQLYHESDGLLAWRRPEEVTAYRTRSRPRDFFVVNQIELPRTLTVGAYRLKVIVRDLGDRSIDERIIPIRVVADPALARGNATTGLGG